MPHRRKGAIGEDSRAVKMFRIKRSYALNDGDNQGCSKQGKGLGRYGLHCNLRHSVRGPSRSRTRCRCWAYRDDRPWRRRSGPAGRPSEMTTTVVTPPSKPPHRAPSHPVMEYTWYPCLFRTVAIVSLSINPFWCYFDGHARF